MPMGRTDDVDVFYGNGKVFVLNPDECHEFSELNFSAESLESVEGPCYFVTSEIVVCCGSGVIRKKAIRSVRLLLHLLESGERDPVMT